MRAEMRAMWKTGKLKWQQEKMRQHQPYLKNFEAPGGGPMNLAMLTPVMAKVDEAMEDGEFSQIASIIDSVPKLVIEATLPELLAELEKLVAHQKSCGRRIRLIRAWIKRRADLGIPADMSTIAWLRRQKKA